LGVCPVDTTPRYRLGQPWCEIEQRTTTTATAAAAAAATTTMPKRSNEHGQIDKSEYDALFSNKSSPESLHGNQPKASLAVQSKRRIIKVKRRQATPAVRKSTMDRKDDVNEANNSNNPFASFKYSKSPAANDNSTVTFDFSSGSSTKKKESSSTKNTVTFNFGSSSNNDNNNKDDKVERLKQKQEERLKKLDESFDQKMREAGSPRSHLPRDVDRYLQYRRLICNPLELALKKKEKETEDSSSPSNPQASPVATTTTETTTTTTNKSVGFTFGTEQKSATTPSAKKTSFGGFNFGGSTPTTTKNSGFSYGSGRGSPGRTPAPSRGFSFGNSPSTTASTTTMPSVDEKSSSTPGLSFGVGSTVTATKPDEEKSASDETEAPETSVEEVEDPDWNTVYRVQRVRYYLFEKENWKGYAKGPMRLQTQNSNSKNKRLLLRDDLGKVHLNVMITNVKFSKKVSSKESSAVKRYYIQFCALRDTEKGMEKIMLQCKAEDHADLLKKLNEIASA